MQFFLHQVAFGDVAGNGQHAVDAADRQGPGRQLAQTDLPVAAADMAAEVADEPVAVELLDQALALVEVDPDAQVEGGLVDGRADVVAGQAAEAFVDLQQQAILLA